MSIMKTLISKFETAPSKSLTADVDCSVCEKNGHMVEDCEKLKREKERDAQKGESTQ